MGIPTSFDSNSCKCIARRTFQSRVGIDGDSYVAYAGISLAKDGLRFSPVSGLMGIPTLRDKAQMPGIGWAGSFQSRVGIDGDSYRHR